MIAVLAGQGRGCCLLLITLGAWKLVNNGNVYFPMSSVMRQVCKRRQLTAQFGRLFLPFSFCSDLALAQWPHLLSSPICRRFLKRIIELIYNITHPTCIFFLFLKYRFKFIHLFSQKNFKKKFIDLFYFGL